MENEDTARLDWIDAHSATVRNDPSRAGCIVKPWSGKSFKGLTVRDAIDAARKEVP